MLGLEDDNQKDYLRLQITNSDGLKSKYVLPIESHIKNKDACPESMTRLPGGQAPFVSMSRPGG